MNSGPSSFWRLTWKEYRAVRGFWLAMIALVVALEVLSIGLSSIPGGNLAMVYGLALGAPAFFALGCCGAAFAVEREEGTFDFLRAAPATPREVMASKMLLAVTSTVAMFAVLWPLALLMSRGRLPEVNQLHGLLGLWLLGAVEAIAWGTFFSLQSARPLVAVCLAMFAATTTAHLLAWSVMPPPFHAFELTPYLMAVPRRAIVAVALLAIDVYLGLRWLDRGEMAARRALRRPLLAPETWGMRGPPTDVSVEGRLWRPDRGGMVGHLLWQQWLQSARLMTLMAFAYIAVALFAWRAARPVDILLFVIGVVPALMGSMVFLADQERRRFRFFAEHNVPPRWVWLTRQLPWLVLLAVATTVACVYAAGPRTPIVLGLAVVAVSYAVGQWVSMMVKSGIMAGFCGVLLAGLLCGWVTLMDALGVSFLWSVAPIPLVLLWATWQRAPDWIAENTTWFARGRATAMVLVPALILLVLVPLYRVYSVDWISPGFDPAQYVSTNTTSDAMATVQLYRRANELLRNHDIAVSDRATTRRHENASVIAPDVRKQIALNFVKENTESLDLLLKAAARPSCMFDDPRTATDRTQVGHGFISLVISSGRQLEAEGKLDEALERYLAALKVVCDLTDHTALMSLGGHQVGKSVTPYSLEGLRLVFDEICNWALHDKQTPERIRGAIERLQAVENTILPLDERLKWNYLVAERYVFGDATVWGMLPHFVKHPPPTMLWPKLLPWEMYRGQRALNHTTAVNLKRLELMRKDLSEGKGVVDYLPALAPGFGDDYYAGPYYNSAQARYNARQREPGWLPSITPDLWSTLELGNVALRALAEFEARKRGTLLVLALEAHRLEHGKLPESLDELVGTYFDELPLDPYSGHHFCYRPQGLPPAATQAEEVERAKMRPRLTVGTPCVWCTGPELRAVPNSGVSLFSGGKSVPLKCDDIAYYTLRRDGQWLDPRDPQRVQSYPQRLASHVASSWGFFFAVPKERP